MESLYDMNTGIPRIGYNLYLLNATHAFTENTVYADISAKAFRGFNLTWPGIPQEDVDKAWWICDTVTFIQNAARDPAVNVYGWVLINYYNQVIGGRIFAAPKPFSAVGTTISISLKLELESVY